MTVFVLQGEVCGNTTNKLHRESNRNTWNAAAWPYENSRVIRALASVLHSPVYAAALQKKGEQGKQGTQAGIADSLSPAVSVETHYNLLLQFARTHTRTFATEDSAHPLHSGHISENLHPDLGYWRTRDWRAQAGESLGATYRGNDYFHSSFIDLVIGGLLGLNALNRSADGKNVTLTVAPLLPHHANVTYFAIDGVRTAAHDVAVLYDADGTRYGRGRGLMIFVDGVLEASSPTLQALHLTLCDDGPVTPPDPKPPAPTPSPSPSPSPRPPSPPHPPPVPVTGWRLLSNLTGLFCCDGLPQCNVPLMPRTTMKACMAKCLATSGCEFVTTTHIPGKAPGCFNAKLCAKQGKYIDTPSPTDVTTWQHSKGV